MSEPRIVLRSCDPIALPEHPYPPCSNWVGSFCIADDMEGCTCRPATGEVVVIAEPCPSCAAMKAQGDVIPHPVGWSCPGWRVAGFATIEVVDESDGRKRSGVVIIPTPAPGWTGKVAVQTWEMLHDLPAVGSPIQVDWHGQIGTVKP